MMHTHNATTVATIEKGPPMTHTIAALDSALVDPNQLSETGEPTPGLRLRWGWLGLWAFLTVFAVFEVAKHGFVNGSPLYAIALTVTAVGSFVAPDLTFLIGAGDTVRYLIASKARSMSISVLPVRANSMRRSGSALKRT